MSMAEKDIATGALTHTSTKAPKALMTMMPVEAATAPTTMTTGRVQGLIVTIGRRSLLQ
jgi:hypothetical protein